MELRSQSDGITPSRSAAKYVGPLALVLLAFALIPVLTLFGQVPITFRYFYDDTGQLTRVVDSTGISIEYVYDAVGNMLEVKRTNAPSGQLTIFSFTPALAGPLALVNIQGQGFATNPSANTVRFNGVPTAVLSATADSLSVRVPIGAISGIISVTVGGNTATSTSNFTVFQVPVLTSLSPKTIEGNLPPSTIQVTGVNLTGATFAFVASGVPQAVVAGTPQIDATGTSGALPVSVTTSAKGPFTLIATNSLGSSDWISTVGNTLVVTNSQDDIDSDGDGHPDGLELLFGSDPFDMGSLPNLTLSGDVRSGPASVRNQAAPYSFATAEQTLLSTPIVIRNLIYPFSSLTEIISAAVLVENSPVISPITTLEKLNADVGDTKEGLDIQIGTTRLTEGSSGPVLEGQTVVINVTGGPDVRKVEFLVNGVSYLVDNSSPFEVLMTVPAGMRELHVDARALGSDDQELAMRAFTFPVDKAGVTALAGRVTDDQGNPVAGATVNVVIDGLHTEFFDFQNIGALPDLNGIAPSSVGTTTAINFRNTQGVLGADPLGTNMVPDYAGRFQGWIRVPQAGVYGFSLGIDAGGRLRIGGQTVIDIPNGTGNHQESAAAMDLAPGLVPIELTYYQGIGNTDLQLSWTPPGGERAVIRPEFLRALPPGLTATTDSAGIFRVENVPTSIAGVQIIAGAQSGGTLYLGSSDRLPLVQAEQQPGVIVLKRQP